MKINEKIWKMIVETNLAGGYAHSLISRRDYETLEIIDDDGNRAVWMYDKKTQTIKLV